MKGQLALAAAAGLAYSVGIHVDRWKYENIFTQPAVSNKENRISQKKRRQREKWVSK